MGGTLYHSSSDFLLTDTTASSGNAELGTCKRTPSGVFFRGTQLAWIK